MGNMSLRNLLKLFTKRSNSSSSSSRNGASTPATSGSSESISSASSSSDSSLNSSSSVAPSSSSRHHQAKRDASVAATATSANASKPAGSSRSGGRRRRNAGSSSGSSAHASKNVGTDALKNQVPHRLDVLLAKEPVGLEEQKKHGWNKDDKSPNVFVKNDGLTVRRYPVAQSSDACRGKVGFTRGLHCWEISWDTRQRGTHAIVGVCTKESPLTCFGYRSLVGQTDQSWGWDLGRNRLLHGGKAQRGGGGQRKTTYPTCLGHGQLLEVPKKVRVVLDMEAGTLSFMADGKYLGVAFTGLKGKTLYPVISCVWGNCEVDMTYLNTLEPEPLCLAELCRQAVRQSIPGEVDQTKLARLPLPPLLQNYVHNRSFGIRIAPPPCPPCPQSCLETTPF